MVLLLGGCFGDRVISEAVFAYQCKTNADSFVYETVDLDQSYIVPIPENHRERDGRFEINGAEMMDRERILKDYGINSSEFKRLSGFGPVESIKTRLVRKSDNKLMGEAVTFRSYGGWLINVWNLSSRGNKLSP